MTDKFQRNKSLGIKKVTNSGSGGDKIEGLADIGSGLVTKGNNEVKDKK